MCVGGEGDERGECERDKETEREERSVFQICPVVKTRLI